MAFDLQTGLSDLSRPVASEAVNDFLWKVYGWMSVGVALTGVIAFVVASSPAMMGALVTNPVLFYGLILGELGMVVAFSIVAPRASFSTAALMFLSYAALNGVTLSVIFVAYTQSSIAQTFFVTAGAFGGLSFFGATTKKQLSGWGRFLFMGLIGVIIASVVNIFFSSPAIYWVTTYAGVFIFAGLTAYDTQKLKVMYEQGGEAGNLALRGALTLYLDFVNLMLFLLRLLGRRR